MAILNNPSGESIALRIMKTDKTHKNSVRLVLLALAECIDSGNSCPPVADIADMAQVTSGSARHALAVLEEDKTITSVKQAGKSEKGGRTNCYAIAGYSDEKPDTSNSELYEKPPSENQETTEIQVGEIHQGTKIPEGESLYPERHDEPETSTVEYVRAAGEKELEKELKEFALKAKQTDSFATGSELEQDAPAPVLLKPVKFDATLPGLTPAEKALYEQALSKANPPTAAQQNAPDPGSGGPLSPDAYQIYRDRKLPMPSGKELIALIALIESHGETKALALVRGCSRLDKHNTPIMNPASWIRKTGDKPTNNQFRARSHDVDRNAPPPKEYPDDMEFEPPPPKPKMAFSATGVMA